VIIVFIQNRFLAIMYLNIRALDIADGLKDALIYANFTIESILEYGPGEIASIIGIDHMLQRLSLQ
jgi:hypothetical protein